MRGFMIGASPCDGETMAFFLNMGIDVALAYGLTELGAPLAVTGPGYYLNSTGRVPHHAPGMDIRVINPDEKGRGEVEILSPFRMISYLHEEDMEGCFTDDGYFRSGDLGYFNDENCLVLCGRAKEAIVLRSGEKLLPEEIEERYAAVQGVSELAVFRVPDGDCDAFSLAAIKDRSEGLPDDIVRMYLFDRASRLPAMYRPQEVYILREFPLSSTRKVQRFRLTEMAVTGQGAPVSEASLKYVEESETVSLLRELLVQTGGSAWKSCELTEGLLLDLDSLQTIDLFVAVQERFGVDLFRLDAPPETFGALVDAVTHFDTADKHSKPTLDLSRYPESVGSGEKALYGSVGHLVKRLWNVHGVGLENLPDDTNFLLCSNHITTLDPGWLCYCLDKKRRQKTAVVGKYSLLDDKLLKNFVRAHHIIPVDRTGNSLPTLDRCRELLGEGWNIIIFPEGTNYENASEMLSFREGPARLSAAAGKPIVPAHIKGVIRKDMDSKHFLPPTGSRIEIVFGKPLYPAAYADPAALNDALRRAIEEL